MNGSNISETFPIAFDKAIELNQVLMPIVMLLTIVSLIGKAMQGMQGDIRSMISGIATTLIIAILIPAFPEIANLSQLALHEVAQSAGANPSDTANELANLIIGEEGNKDLGWTDILFDSNGGVGKTITYWFVSGISVIALLFQSLFAIAQQFLFVFAIALSPIFFGFLLLGETRSIATNYFVSIFAIGMWPIGFALSDIVASSFLEMAASAKIKSDFLPGFVLRTSIGIFLAFATSIWIFVSTIGAPYAIHKAITTGTNAGGILLQRMGAAVGLGAAYGIMARGTAQLSGASALHTNAATAAATAGGIISGATDSPSLLTPAIIGMSAAKSNLGGKSSDEPTDYNAKADEIANRNKS